MTDSAPAPLRVLLVEDDDAYARLIGDLLEGWEGSELFPRIELSRVPRLGAARRHLSRGGIGVVLLDLSLPDSQGLATVAALAVEFPELPIIVVTATASESVALRALQCGAQDYLIKSEVDARSLLKSMRYSLERHRLQEQLRSLAVTDPLTGVHNRRGFMTFAERQLKLVHRRTSGALVLVMDLDGLKTINDKWGHAEGDRALSRVADALRASFRDADIIGRIGGDEFAVLALDVASGDEPALVARIGSQLASINQRPDQPYMLRLSMGWARLEPQTQAGLAALMAEADGHLYRHKMTHAADTIVKSDHQTRA
jgi:diguanylate cyclase (GGDEF)-like protein